MLTQGYSGFIHKLATIFRGRKEVHPAPYRISLKAEPAEYQIICNGIVLGHTTFQPEVDVFLINNRIKPGSDAYEAALAGRPFTANGVTTRFIRIERG